LLGAVLRSPPIRGREPNNDCRDILADVANFSPFPEKCLSFPLEFFARPLKPFRLFLIFRLPRYAVRVPSGARERRAPVGVRSLLVSNLLNGGFGYEDHNFRFRPPLAVHHRL
jgi:hypothetical protein